MLHLNRFWGLVKPPGSSMQENTYISCIRDRPPQLGPLLKLDENAPVCKNRLENFLHEGRRHHDNPGGPDWVRAPAVTVIY